MQLINQEVTMRLFKDYIVPVAVGIGLASAIALTIHHFKPKEVVPLPLADSIVCMQDAPILYDWNQELITNIWHDGVVK